MCRITSGAIHRYVPVSAVKWPPPTSPRLRLGRARVRGGVRVRVRARVRFRVR